MARHSEVLIQGINVPQGRMIVTVPVDHTFAPDTARNVYPYEGAQYIWRKSWNTDQPAPRNGGSSPSGGGLGGLVILAGPLIILGSIFGGGEDTPTAPTYNAPASVESTYTPQAPATPSWDNGPCVTANFEPC